MGGYCSCRNGFLDVESDHPEIVTLAESILTDINQYLAENQLDFCMKLSLESMNLNAGYKVIIYRVLVAD